MVIKLEFSRARHKGLIEKCNEDVVIGYFDRIKETDWYVCLFPCYLVFLCFYGIYLSIYGFLLVLSFLQEGGEIAFISDIDNGFLRLLLYVVLLPIHFVLYIISLIFPLVTLLLLEIFFGVIFVLQYTVIGNSKRWERRKKLEEKIVNHMYRLAEWQALFEKGEITKEEFEEKEREILQTPLTQLLSEINND